MDHYDATMILLARGGSKGLPNKNLQTLQGTPLVRRTAETAKNSGIFSEIIVSSDSAEILQSVSDLGISIHKRSIEKSSDSATSEDSLLEVVHECSVETKFCSLMQCTTPFVTIEDIKCVAELQLQNPTSSIATGFLQSVHHWQYDVTTGKIEAITQKMILRKPRQKGEKIFVENGGIYSFPTESFIKLKSRFMETTVPHIMDKENSIDIDTIADLKYANFLLES